MAGPAEIVHAAVAASTAADAVQVQAMLRIALGGGHVRPLGDTWNNHGLMGSSGNYDYKLIELVTNMQDAVLELLARTRFGEEPIPYRTPHAAAGALLAGLDENETADMATVTLRESDPPADKTKRLTAVFRDHGCGLTPDAVPRTIFRLGGSHKVQEFYLQGAFGMGGAMTYRNAAAVVLVSRRHPDLLADGEEDRITVAVVEWQENAKGSTALYLVDNEWDQPGDEAEPWCCPAADVPDFEPGTHLALISYRTDGIQRKTERDTKSFNTVADTRLYAPVMPLRFTNENDRGRRTILRGLERRLEQTSAADLPTHNLTLPFRSGGETYHLPIRYVLFNPANQAGSINNFVAAGHTLLFTSNGQVHHHWNATQFRQKSGFNKIYNRVLVVVETDELPIHLRTSLFTSDRNDLVRTDDAIRLEEAVVATLKGWDELIEQNSALVREGLRASGSQLTADLGRRIGMAFKATGFATTGGNGRNGGKGAGTGRSGGGGGGVRKQVTLHPDPTCITGPGEVKAEVGGTKSVGFVVDVVDEFWGRRGSLVVTSDHPDIGEREITVGEGRKGRVRVLIAIPETAALGPYTVNASLTDWHRAAGGLGPDLAWTTKIELVTEIEGHGAGAGSRRTGASGGDGPGAGPNVALRWTNHETQEGWTRTTVGEVEDVAAADLAATVDEYKDLADLGDTPIPTISLNEEYPPYKHYLENRSRTLTELDRPREQYALGVGLSLLVLRQSEQQAREKGQEYPEELLDAASQAAARGILAVMPQFDEMIKQAALIED